MLFLLTTFALESRCKDTNISRYGKIKKMPPRGNLFPRGGNVCVLLLWLGYFAIFQFVAKVVIVVQGAFCIESCCGIGQPFVIFRAVDGA